MFPYDLVFPAVAKFVYFELVANLALVVFALINNFFLWQSSRDIDVPSQSVQVALLSLEQIKVGLGLNEDENDIVDPFSSPSKQRGEFNS